MKKILLFLIFLFTFLSIIGNAQQMKITTHLNETFCGYTFNYKFYEAFPPSNYCLIFLHGKGETGPADGSRIDSVGVHGFPMHAEKGFSFPFNIIAPQSVTNHNQVRHFLPQYVKEKYKAKVIIITGLSMGGFGAIETMYSDRLKLVYACAVVCGSGSLPLAVSYPEMKCWQFHGAEDPTVNYRTAKAFIDKYNLTHTAKIRWTLYPSVGHNAWDKAYSVKPGDDELLQQIMIWFNEAPKEPNCDDLKRSVQTFLQLWHRGMMDLEQSVFHIEEAIRN